MFTGFWLGGLKGRELGRPRCRWKDKIKMDLRETGINEVNWIWLAVDSLVASFCEHGNEPSGSIKKASYSLTS
jgi:hypothetical protein